MREVYKLEHRLVTEEEFRELEFVKGSTDYEYSSERLNQGGVWNFTVQGIIKKVDDKLLRILMGPSVWRITGVEETLEIGRTELPVRASFRVDEQHHMTISHSDIALNRRRL